MQERKTYTIFAIFALTLTVLCTDTYAQRVDIPDPNLRAAVRETLDIADRPEVQVRCIRILRRHLRGLNAGKTAASRTSPVWNTPPPSLLLRFLTTIFPI